MVRVNSLWRQVLQEGGAGKVSTLDLKGAVDQNLSAMAFRGPVNFYGNLFTTNPTLREVNAVRAKAGWWTAKEINFSCTLMLATEKVVYLYIWNEPPIENIMPVERGPVLVPHGPRCYHDKPPAKYAGQAGYGNSWSWSIQNPPEPGEDGWWYVIGSEGDPPFLVWTTPCINVKPTVNPTAIANMASASLAWPPSGYQFFPFYSKAAWELTNAYYLYDDSVWFSEPFDGWVGEVLVMKATETQGGWFQAVIIDWTDPASILALGNKVYVNPGEIGVSSTGLFPWKQPAGVMIPYPAYQGEVNSGHLYEEISGEPGSYFKAIPNP